MASVYDTMWSYALKQAERRPMSRFILKKKLLTVFPDAIDTVGGILDEMERAHLISDTRYADALIRHLCTRPIGRLKLMNEARQRGLDADQFHLLLDEAGYDETEHGRKALEMKEKTIREEDPRKRKFKLMNFLKGRGFTNAVIYSVLGASD